MQSSMAQRLRTPRLNMPADNLQSVPRPRLPTQRVFKAAKSAQHARSSRIPAHVFQTADTLGQRGEFFDERPSCSEAAAAQNIYSFIERLRCSIVTAVAAGIRLTSLAVRFVAALVHGGALQAWISALRRQQLEQGVEDQRLAQQLAKERLTQRAVLREAAKENQDEITHEVSEEERAFCSMILRQDNPQRSLEDKWADLRLHMHGGGSQQFRNVTGQLYSTASISCANIQAALKGSDPEKPPAGINKLLEQHGCVEQEEALRSMLFAQLLTAQQR